MRYKANEHFVNALAWDGKNTDKMREFLNQIVFLRDVGRYKYLWLPESELVIDVNEVVVKGTENEKLLIVLKPETFKSLFGETE